MSKHLTLSYRTNRLLFILAALLLPIILQSSELPLSAVHRAEAMGVFSVNSTLDERDADLLDNTCFSTPSGLCTLRAAIDQAAYNSGSDTIILQENKTYKLTIPGQEDNNAGGDLDIRSDLTFEVANGGQAIIDGNRSVLDDSVFQIFQGSVTMTGLIIQNSSRGGIQNASSLTLQDVTVQDNIGPACIVFTYGGIGNTGDLKMFNTTVSGNSGNDGGGIRNLGTLLAVNSTISGNSSFKSGGGIYNAQLGGFPPPAMTLRNTTVTRNLAAVCGSGSGGGIANFAPTSINLANTILANNSRGLVFPSDDDCFGTVNSFGYNLIRTTLGCTVVGTAAGNIYGTNPLLGPLQINGGETSTHALLAGSPAIDSGNPLGCKNELGINIAFDQRGVTRHLDGGTGSTRCDIGAYEYDVLTPPPPPPNASYVTFIPFISK